MELKKLSEAAEGKYFLRLISAEAHAQQNDDSLAEQQMLEALRSNPSAPEAYISLGQLLFCDAAASRQRARGLKRP